MASEKVERFLGEAVRLLVERAHAERIVLFGSQAWGAPDPRSDVDLLVVLRSPDAPVDRRIRLGDLMREVGERLPLDILALTPEELAERLALGDPFVKDILDRGRVLYAA